HGREALLDRGARRPQIARQCPDQVVGLHGLAPNLTDSAASPRCSATRTAPSLILSLAAVSRIDAPSSEIARTTLCWRSGRLCRCASSLPGSGVGSSAPAARVSTTSSIGTYAR